MERAIPSRPVASMSARVVVIIVNYRTANLVVDCLRSMEAEMARLGPGASVVVVDNASGDRSAQTLAAAIADAGWGAWAQVRPLEENLGFSGGNNAVLRPHLASNDSADYYLLLNPDTVCREGAIEALVHFMQDHPRAGIAGSRLEDPNGSPQCSAHQMITPLSELVESSRLGMLSRALRRHVVSPPLDASQAQRSDWVSGASFMVRREVFEQIGLLDEGYFLYFDEVDFCRRAARAGWETWYVPQSRVVHLEGQATGISESRRRRGHWWYESRRRFFIKSYGVLGLIAADVFFAVGRLSLLMRHWLGLGGSVAGDPLCFSRDLLWGDVKALWGGKARSIRDAEAQP